MYFRDFLFDQKGKIYSHFCPHIRKKIRFLSFLRCITEYFSGIKLVMQITRICSDCGYKWIVYSHCSVIIIKLKAPFKVKLYILISSGFAVIVNFCMKNDTLALQIIGSIYRYSSYLINLNVAFFSCSFINWFRIGDYFFSSSNIYSCTFGVKILYLSFKQWFYLLPIFL